jgi:hypothetical protein
MTLTLKRINFKDKIVSQIVRSNGPGPVIALLVSEEPEVSAWSALDFRRIPCRNRGAVSIKSKNVKA